MNPSSIDPWRGHGGPANDNQGGRPYGAFGPNGIPQQSHGLPPPPVSNYPHQHNQPQPGQAGHSLSIADLTQSGPPVSQYNTQPPPHTQAHPLNSLSSAMSHQSPNYLARDRSIMDILRDREEREMRDMRNMTDIRDRDGDLRQRERMEREARERHLDRMSREQQQAPVQSHAGSIPLHQPVASKVQGSLQGPNGLLGNGGSVVAQAAANPVSQAFGHSQNTAQPATQPYLTQASPAMAQQQIANGQQPILNDALSYLDQVKMRFADQPDVYNRFLDIMKDFKSQAIDTPGVINRVSELFNGHPALIQGFNTFLPPGYRIECGTDDNPDAIRVTTPSGTMTQSLQTRARGGIDLIPSNSNQPGLSRQDTIESGRVWNQQPSPNPRPARLSAFDQNSLGRDNYDSDAMQQDQRNVSQLQNAVTAAQNGQTRMASSPPPGSQGLFSQQGTIFGNGNDPKRGGPVEFNHAISYVNKIKNRFAQQPEIYKQFLEILQTYQRESKPIQDVYSQVTQLFIAAPDLLEDFKQFLPESAAHAKAQAAAQARQAEVELSSVRNEPGYAASLPQTQTPRPVNKMPPLGHFDPPSTTKDSKKRKAPGPGSAQIPPPAVQDSRSRGVETQPANKRQKFDNKGKTTEVVNSSAIDPNLIPALPEPLPPASTASTSQDELGFFDRAKKQIGNRATYTEFLKLINLYSQDIIDKYVLADRVQSFIGSNPDLMAYFRGTLNIQEHDEIVESRMRTDSGRVNLAHCRAYGPSYRHLPKRDQNKLCKGRDGMCFEVLNDVWASHPTWASEDSGFVAHRKNQYEEALHRIEEERHDYDFHIESCLRSIQLMEPIVAQINTLNDHEKASFRVEKAFGGASEAIPKRVILKIYGRDIGNSVLNDLYARPAQVMPVVLNRLKQKLEEWKQVQREWEKVWRDQTQKQFWKSLDHQGIAQRNADKRNFQPKTLTLEIQAKYEEQKRSRDEGKRSAKYQLAYKFLDEDVLIDTTQLIIAGLSSDKNDISSSVQSKIRAWLQDFVVKFFGLERDSFSERLEAAVQQAVSPPAEVDEEIDSDGQQSSSRKSKTLAKSGESLRRNALLHRNNKEDSLAPTSKDSTPAPETMSQTSAEQEQPSVESLSQSKKWINIKQTESPVKELDMDEAYPHATFNFYSNATLYCFFRLFQMLYGRLLDIKNSEDTMRDAIKRHRGTGMTKKPALTLRMIDKTPDEFFKDIEGTRSFYDQILDMCCEVLLGRVDREHLEETLRRYYNKYGWQLYTVDKLVHAIIRFLITINGPDTKEKSLEIANLFFKDREREETTRKIELQYRKQVEKLTREGEFYRITWNPNDKTSTIRIFLPHSPTYEPGELTEEARWQYYVASYTMSEQTEGVHSGQLKKAFLQRNIPPQSPDPRMSYAETIGNLNYTDDQAAFIDLENYKLVLSGIYAFEKRDIREGKQYTEGQKAENEAFREKFLHNVAWMKDQSAEDVDKRKEAWNTGLKEGLGDLEARAVSNKA